MPLYANRASPLRENAGIPRPIILVKPYRAVVPDGENIGRVAQRFSGDPDRWPELMAANVGVLRFGRIPEGYSVALPAELKAGTALFVPATWPDVGAPAVMSLPVAPFEPVYAGGAAEPVYAGGAAAAPINLGQWFGAVLGSVAAVAQGRQPTDPPDVGRPWQEVGQVVLSWWPYLPTQPGAPDMPPITELVPAMGKAVIDYVLALVASAVRFLESGGTPAVAVQVPWGAVPWDQVPWMQIAEEFPGRQEDFWQFLRKATAPPVQFSPAPGARPTPPASAPQWPSTPSQPAAQPFYPFDPRRNSAASPGANMPKDELRPQAKAATGALSQGGSPIAFATANWGDYTNVAWTEVPWGSIFWSFFSDPDVYKCATANPGRLRQMYDCSDCYEGAGVEHFKQVLCDLNMDPCACRPLPPPPKPPGGEVPPTPTTPLPNWSCTPFPECLAQPGNWPEGLAKPCTPFPACVPDWIKSQGGQVPGQPPPEKKPDNTFWWLLGGGAVLTLIVGTIAVTAARS